MRIDLRDINGMNWSIDSTNTKLIAEWIEDMIPYIAATTAEYHIPWQIQIWPRDEKERMHLKSVLKNPPQIPEIMDVEGLDRLIGAFIDRKSVV